MDLTTHTSRTIRHNLLGTVTNSQRQLWQVALSMGHSDPMMTLGNYLHCEDLLAGVLLRRLFPANWDRQQMAQLLQTSTRTLDRALATDKPEGFDSWRDPYPYNDWLEWWLVRQQNSEAQTIEETPTELLPTVRTALPESKLEQWQLWQRVMRKFVEDPNHEIVTSSPFTPEVLQRWHNNLQQLPLTQWRSRQRSGEKSQPFPPFVEPKDYQALQLLLDNSEAGDWIEFSGMPPKKLPPWLEALFQPDIKWMRQSWCDVASHKPTRIKSLITLMQNLGIDRPQLEYLWIPSRTSTIAMPSQRKQWQKNLHATVQESEQEYRQISTGSQGAIIMRVPANYCHRFILATLQILWRKENRDV